MPGCTLAVTDTAEINGYNEDDDKSNEETSGGLQGCTVSCGPPRPRSHWSPAASLGLQKVL